MKIKLKGKLFDYKDFSNEELANATTEMVANQVWLNEEFLDFKKSLIVRNHSETGFAWGFTGSGASQMALSICMELFGIEIAVSIYQDFKEKYVSPLPDSDFEQELDLSNWEKNLEKLKHFKLIYEHTDVPLLWTNDKVLANWVNRIQSLKYDLSYKLIKELLKLNFNFNPRLDTDWDQMYQRFLDFKRYYGHLHIPSNVPIHEQLFNWVENQRKLEKHLSIRKIDILNRSKFPWKKPNRREDAWWFMYYELKRFKDKYGHINVQSETEFKDDCDLVSWLRKIKHAYNDPVKKAKIDLLGRIDVEQDKKGKEAIWNKKFEELIKFKNRFGHFDITIELSGDSTLRMWAYKQKQKEQNGLLRLDRKEKLDSINFPWFITKIKNTKDLWNKRFDELKRFKDENGHIQFPPNHPQYQELQKWVIYLRQQKKHEELSNEKLDSLGFLWEKIREDNWEKMYNQLFAYKVKYGHAIVFNKKNNPTKLSSWARGQRGKWQKGTLSKEKFKRLESMGFAWSTDINSSKWIVMYNDLVDFKNMHGHINIPQEMPEYQFLYEWMVKQKEDYNEGILIGNQISLLKNVGVIF